MCIRVTDPNQLQLVHDGGRAESVPDEPQDGSMVAGRFLNANTDRAEGGGRGGGG